MKYRYLALAPLLMLAACVEPDPMVNPPADACGAVKYEGLIGQPAKVLDNMTFPTGTRIIQPNAPVTMDFRPDRLNIEISNNGRIDKISCY